MSDTFAENEPVTAVICQFVKPGLESAYEEWVAGISAVARGFEGHCGVSIIRPTKEIESEYVIILRFDRYSHLRTWMESDTRKEWIEKAKMLVRKSENVQLMTGLETWFSLPEKPLKLPPPRYKMVIITWFAVYSCITVIQYFLGPIFKLLPPVIASILSTGIVVAMLTYVVMPRLTRLFYRWLYPKSKGSI
ncbi:MAG TPA: antibiotic biosynthesis monooxygenase [Kamptonema sp.]|nr:antibiotic biosynthesis monooxygenase [Kamptonema sp.]